MTRNTQTSMYDVLMEIAGMMVEDGYTAAEVTAVAAELQNIKSSLWDLEKMTGKDLGTKIIGGNAWILDKVAIYMEAYFEDTSRDFWADTYEDAAIVSRKCAEILDPIYYNDDDNDDDDCSTYYNTDRPYYNDDDLLAFLGEFAEEYDIEAIRNDVTFYDYQAGQRYWEPAYTDDADALMRVCDLHHMEEFEECPSPALQAEIDEAKREDECKDDDDEYEAWQRLKAKADLIPDEAYTELDNALTDEAYMIYSGQRLELADGTPTSWTWIDPATFFVSELHGFTAIIDDEGHQGYYAYTAPAAEPDDAHASVDDSWMDRRCYATIRAKDAASGQRIDVDPPTWRDKLEMEHKLREDGYEFVDVTTDGPNLVLLWYRPMMPRPMVDELIDTIKGC